MLGLGKFQDITIRKFIRIISNRLVYTLCFHAVNRRDIAVQQNVLTTYYFLLITAPQGGAHFPLALGW